MKTSALSKALFWHKDTFFCMTSLTVQQIIVAFSTYFIIKLGEAIGTHTSYIHYLILFMGSLVIVYVPGILYGYFLEKTTFNATYHYLQLFTRANQGQVTRYNSPQYRKEKEPWLTSESEQVIAETTTVFSDGLATALNALLSALVIGIFIDSTMFLAFLGGFLVLLLTVKLTGQHVHRASQESQESRKEMQNCLLNGWDNIVIHNKYSLKSWMTWFNTAWKKSRTTAIREHMVMNLASSGAMTFATLPMMAVTGYVFFQHVNDWVVLSAIVVTLPRQIQILQSIFQLFSYVLEWKGLQAKFQGLAASLEILEEDKAEERVDWENIYFTDEKGQEFKTDSLTRLLELIQSNPRRITLRGANGAGKSTVFGLLKNALGDRAFYLPTSSNLHFKTTVETHCSTGEKIKNILFEMKEALQDVSYILLDEWDANLDADNKALISEQISALATDKCVIEIRHHF